MKTLSASTLILTLAVGISASFMSPAWAQQYESFGAPASTEAWGPDVVGTLPVENEIPASDVPPVDEITSVYDPENIYDPDNIYQQDTTYQTETFSDQSFEGNVVTDASLFPRVKNVNFFGVDREECCDEWAGLCKCKSPKYRCNCGGLKANKGHLGIFWLKSKYGGDGCDFCNGGCCEKGCSGKACSEFKESIMKCCFLKNRRKKTCAGSDESAQETIFGRPLKSNCDRCGCCDEGCPPKKGCESCN